MICVNVEFCIDCVGYVAQLFFFFFKQKTAYEMRISDWSSDVCSSDLWPHSCLLAPVACCISHLNWSTKICLPARLPSVCARPSTHPTPCSTPRAAGSSTQRCRQQ